MNKSSISSSSFDELSKVKMERKKVEINLKLLENRITLLEKEEKKALKSIEATRKKIEQINSMKIKSEEHKKIQCEVRNKK